MREEKWSRRCRSAAVPNIRRERPPDLVIGFYSIDYSHGVGGVRNEQVCVKGESVHVRRRMHHHSNP